MKRSIYFLVLVGFLSSPLASEASLIEEKKCGECHRLSEKETEKNGPDLFYAGNKFQALWLERYLQSPEVIRIAGYTNDPGFLKGESQNSHKHSALSKMDAKQITHELVKMTLPDLSQELSNAKPLTKGQKAKIKYQFERTFGCIACHQSLNLAGKVRGGISGPSLVDAGNRLQANWVASWLKTPKTFFEKGRMPIYQMDDETRLQFAQFIMTLKKENMR